MPGCGHRPFQCVWVFPRHRERRGWAGDRSCLGQMERMVAHCPRRAPCRWKDGRNQPSFPLASLHLRLCYHTTEKRKGCGVHRSAPGFEGTRVIYFGKSTVFLSSGALTAALRRVGTRGGLHAARSRVVLPASPRLRSPWRHPTKTKQQIFVRWVFVFKWSQEL